MSDSRLENESGLIIDPALLMDIRAQCEGRRHELEAAGTLPPSSIAPELSQGAAKALSVPQPIPEAERFAAALETMPANVRRFFQADDPFVSPRQLQSAQDRLERQARASFGGWAGG
jgi:hypothetical protein